MKENVVAVRNTKRKISLHGQHHNLANVHEQVEILEHSRTSAFALPSFQQKLKQSGLYPLQSTGADTLQINMGKNMKQYALPGKRALKKQYRSSPDWILLALRNIRMPLIGLLIF